MSSDAWLPVVTLVFGIVLGYVADWLTEKRTIERERRERWRAFQRETLLEVQELIADEFGTSHELALLTLKARESAASVSEFDVSRAQSLGDKTATAYTRINVLRTRIEDESAFKLLGSVLDNSVALSATENAPALEQALQTTQDSINRFHTRARQLLSELY